MKSVMAIGNGSTLARLMSISTTARAGLDTSSMTAAIIASGRKRVCLIIFIMQPFSA